MDSIVSALASTAFDPKSSNRVRGAYLSSDLVQRLKAEAASLSGHQLGLFNLKDPTTIQVWGLTFKESPLLPDNQIVWVDGNGVPVLAQKTPPQSR